MVYRRHAEELGEERNDGPLLRVDASGDPGADGADGRDGGDGSGSGDDGMPGGDAGNAVPGQRGGIVQVRLEAVGDDAVSVMGRRTIPTGEQAGVREGQIRFGDAGHIVLTARGGDGGHGGDGGRGGDGARGYAGRDATRYSSGSDGGPGGDGGDGGRATSGAAGGSGGTVVVEVDETATHLLMLVEHDVGGGAGGAPGKNGSAGSGGTGGSGGSSYSWSETEYYTDSQGNQQSRTTSHYNSGGSAGPSGSPGSPGTAKVRAGRDGVDGSFSITVQGAGGPKNYGSRYHLELTGFVHQSGNQDGIYEPQEKVRVSEIEVTNVGGMPTPKHQDLEVRLAQQGWVLPADEKLIVPPGLAAGASHTFGEALTFTLGDFRPSEPDGPIAYPETVRHRADLPAVRRFFEGFDTEAADALGGFVIRFPVEADAIEGLPSLAPGEAGRIRFSITNVSKAPLGRATDAGRRVRLRLSAHESELGDDHACLLAGDDSRVPLDTGEVIEVDTIAPGQTLSFDATVGFLPGAPHYRSVNLWLVLELGYLDTPAKLRPAQIRSYRCRVAQRYQPDDDADLLLVVNHRCERAELAAWRQVADELGFSLSVFDVSLEGSLSFAEDRAGGSLADRFAGKTVVILNDVVAMPGGRRADVLDLVDKRELIEASARRTSVAFVGEAVDLEELLIPTHGDHEESGEELETMAEALVQRPPEDEGMDLHWSRPARHWAIFRELVASRVLRRRAQKLAERVARRLPHLRFVVVVDPQPKQLDKTLWMTKWDVGRVKVRGMLPAAAGRVVSAAATEEELRDPSWITGDGNVLTLLLTRGFDEKLERLDALLDGRRGPLKERPLATLLRLVLDALAVDLVNELNAVLASRWREGLSGEALVRATPLLQRLASFSFAARGGLDLDGEELAELARFAVRVERFAYYQWRFWELVPPFPWLRRSLRTWWRVRRVLRDTVADLIVGDAEGDEAKQRREAIAVARKTAENTEASAVRHEYGDGASHFTKGLFCFEQLIAPIEREGITTDAEVLASWSDRVVDQERYAAMAERDAGLDDRRRALAAATADAGRALARGSTRDLL